MTLPIRDPVKIDYTNWRGERAERLIRPIEGSFRFDCNEWHPDPQWLFDAIDMDRGLRRCFAMGGVHGWVLTK